MSKLTYKDLKDNITSKVTSHTLVKTIHFGELSDLDTPKDGVTIVYPQVFFNTTNIKQLKTHIEVTMYMIVHEQTINESEDSIIQSQSDMFDIATDILSYYGYTTGEQIYTLSDLDVDFIPFIENTGDMTAGVTGILIFRIPQPRSNCNNPIS